MQTETNFTIEILNVIASCLTPIIILVLGVKINNKVERSKIGIIKEKEWQVRWADLFLNQAIEFNKNISIIVCSLYELQFENNRFEIKKINCRITESKNIIKTIDWDIQNFAQFAELNKDTVIQKQKLLIKELDLLMKNKQGDLEQIRLVQFEYNQAVRKAHNEILMTIKLK